MSTSKTAVSNLIPLPVSAFRYRQAMADVSVSITQEALPEPEVSLTQVAFLERLGAERASAIADVETRLRQEYQQRSALETVRISEALAAFELSRKDYFSRVEIEVVQLALAIAGKILHREAQVDPLLVGALVQIALGQLKEGAAAVIRVIPADAQRWRKHFDSLGLKVAVNVVEDSELQPGDCILETEIGTVNFGLDVQLKEVERGFFDVLAHRPQF